MGIDESPFDDQPDKPKFVRDMGIGMYPPPQPGTTDLKEPGMFVSNDGLVISWLGENYYKACGVEVVSWGMGTSSCVKRVNHSGDHEDYDGRIRSVNVTCELCHRSMDDHRLLTKSRVLLGEVEKMIHIGWLCPIEEHVNG